MVSRDDGFVATVDASYRSEQNLAAGLVENSRLRRQLLGCRPERLVERRVKTT